jgi:hypothetical protein
MHGGVTGMKQDIRTFVAECDTYQSNKGKTVKAPDTLQPLSIPPTILRDISMDFIIAYLNREISQSSWW